MNYGTKKKISFNSFFSTFILFENLFFFNYHSNRGSVVPLAVMGKLFYISGTKNFDFYKYEIIKGYEDEFKIISEASKKINLFTNSIKNPFLKSELKSDYEVVLQYQNIFYLDNYREITNFLKQNYRQVFYEILKNNPSQYFKISTTHYMGMWVAGSKFTNNFYNNEKYSPIPFSDFLKKNLHQI